MKKERNELPAYANFEGKSTAEQVLTTVENKK